MEQELSNCPSADRTFLSSTFPNTNSLAAIAKMKFLLSNILILSLCSTALGQTFERSLIDSLCNSTIEFYFNELSRPLDSIESKYYKPINPYIIKSEITQGLRSHFNNFKVEFLTKQQALEKISMTKSKTGNLEKIIVNQIKDTINVDIFEWTIKITKVDFFKRNPKNIQAMFGANCGGILGDIPTCKFVFDRVMNKWKRYTRTEIINQILDKRKANSDVE